MAIDRDKRTDNRGATLTPGARVLSGDRQKLGAVKDVDGTYFKVDAPAQRDYWLSSDDIESIDADEVVLAFDKSTLDAHKLTSPGLEPGEDPFRDMTVEPVISSEELLDQRARMERQLAEQSKHLPHLPATPTDARDRREEERIPRDHSGFGELAGESVPYAPAVSDDEYRERAKELIDATPVVRASDQPTEMRDDQRVTTDQREPSRTRMMIDEIESTTAVGRLTPAFDGEPVSSPLPDNSLAERDTPLVNDDAPAHRASTAATPRVAYPQDVAGTAPYAPVRQQQPAPPMVHEPLRRNDDADPKSVFERVTGAAGGPILEVAGDSKSAFKRVASAATSPVVVAGAIATMAITVPMYVARRTGVSKLDLPMLLGSFVRKPDEKARLIGLVPHTLQSALIMPSAYRAGFRALGIRPSAKSGLMLAMPHLASSAAAAAIVGKLNPRAVLRGDEKLLERVGNVKAPGFAGRRHGVLTVVSFVAGHAMYGAIIGWWLGKSEKRRGDDVLHDQPTL